MDGWLGTCTDVNRGYKARLSRVRSLNGQAVHNLQHLITMVEGSSVGDLGNDPEAAEWLDFELDDGHQHRIILPRQTARRADLDVLRKHRIPFYRQQSVEERGPRPERRAKEKERLEKAREAFRKEAAEKGWVNYLKVGIIDEDDDYEGDEEEAQSGSQG